MKKHVKSHLFTTLFAGLAFSASSTMALELPQPASDSSFYPRNEAKEELGKVLFFDKVLSGNQNISCATCHHPLADTGDGLSLPVGEGARGLGVTRDTGTGDDAIHERVPRNAPHVFNLGAREFVRMFHDGRLEIDASQPGGFLSPAGDQLPDGLDNPLAAQAMFPVTSGAEMAGQPGENTIADAAADNNLGNPGGVWEQLAARLQAIPGYLPLFQAAYPGEVVDAGDITYVHAANAIGAFEAAAWRADDSPFDRHLRGSRGAMSPSARRGMRVFYGKARCASCHSGTFQTDQGFHAIAIPQVGPGKGDNAEGYDDGLDDFGRERVTGDVADRYKFRTPTLRNVALTGPWGHDGAYNSLEAMVRHHLNPVESLDNYDATQLVMPSASDEINDKDLVVQGDAYRRGLIAAAVEIDQVDLSEREFQDLMDFLNALTDPSTVDLRNDVPTSVPSGLTLAE